MSDTISRDEAIDRMKAGLPCHTNLNGYWRETRWEHFERQNVVFRKPPEPRRFPKVIYAIVEDHEYRTSPQPFPGSSPFREVLPGDVVLQRMTEAEAIAEFETQWSGTADWDEQRIRSRKWWIASRRFLGLIGEGS